MAFNDCIAGVCYQSLNETSDSASFWETEQLCGENAVSIESSLIQNHATPVFSSTFEFVLVNTEADDCPFQSNCNNCLPNLSPDINSHSKMHVFEDLFVKESHILNEVAPICDDQLRFPGISLPLPSSSGIRTNSDPLSAESRVESPASKLRSILRSPIDIGARKSRGTPPGGEQLTDFLVASDGISNSSGSSETTTRTFIVSSSSNSSSSNCCDASDQDSSESIGGYGGSSSGSPNSISTSDSSNCNATESLLRKQVTFSDQLSTYLIPCRREIAFFFGDLFYRPREYVYFCSSALAELEAFRKSDACREMLLQRKLCGQSSNHSSSNHSSSSSSSSGGGESSGEQWGRMDGLSAAAAFMCDIKEARRLLYQPTDHDLAFVVNMRGNPGGSPSTPPPARHHHSLTEKLHGEAKDFSPVAMTMTSNNSISDRMINSNMPEAEATDNPPCKYLRFCE